MSERSIKNMSPRTPKQFESIREASRDKILNVALQLFSSKGYHNTSTRQIAKEAKVSDGFLYNYFKSKENLAIAVLQSAFKTLDAAIKVETGNDATQNLTLAITGFIDLLETATDKIRLIVQMGIYKDEFTFLNEINAKKHEQSVAVFEEYFKQLNYENSTEEARVLVAILDGLVLEALLMDNHVNLEDRKAYLIQKYTRV